MAALEAEIQCQNERRGINVQVSFLDSVFHIT